MIHITPNAALVLQKITRRLTVALLVFAAMAAQAQQIRFEPTPDQTQGYPEHRAWVDVNNDGRDDYCSFHGAHRENLICYPSTGTGFGSPFAAKVDWTDAKRTPGYWVDVNGDGKVDFCRLMYPVVTGGLSCRLGGDFSVALSTTLPMAGDPGPGLLINSEIFFADVDTDGRADLCYLHWLGGTDRDEGELRCRLSTGTGFAPDSAVWRPYFDSIVNINPEWPRGFYDFNGDGYPDFCRVRSDARLGCTLGGGKGFSSSEVVSEPLSDPYDYKGAAFLDFNGDGKTDFCRPGRVQIGSYTVTYQNPSGGTTYITVPSYEYRLTCNISNGRSWESNVRTSLPLDLGHSIARWWADINGDGLPDFCRATGGGNPDGNDDFYDDYSDMSCRLNLGGGDDEGAPAFASADLKITGVNFGRADGGRGFCDPHGRGIQTFCRTTKRAEETGEQQCDDNGSCFPVAVLHGGLFTGLSDTVQAQQPLLMAFSDGLGAETRITYLPLTHPDVYKRSGYGTYPRALIQQPATPVVFETRAWQRSSAPESQWRPLTGTARYFYKDLRHDIKTSSRGFRERWMLSEGSNTIDHQVYFQGLGPEVDTSSLMDDVREVGQVRMQERFAIVPGLIQPPANAALNARQRFLKEAMDKASSLTEVPAAAPTSASPFILLQRTTNTLGTTLATTGGTGPQMAADNPRFRPIAASTTQSWDWNGTALVPMPQAESMIEVDSLGNITRLVQTTTQGGQRWQKTTTNVYAQDNRSTWLLGRLTRSTVVSTAPSAQAQMTLHTPSAPAAPPQSPSQQKLSPAVMSAILELLLD